MKILTILVLSLCWFSVNATSWRVNNNPAINADFATFEAAHDAASPGDTIYVEGNGEESHYGLVTISKKLIVIGPGYFLNENDSTQANTAYARFRAITIDPGAEGTEIYGLQMYYNGAGYMGIIINASNVVIARNYFQGDRDRIVFGAYNINNIAILQNYAYDIRGTYLFGANNVLIANNFVITTVSLTDLSSGVIINNVVKSSIFAENSQIKNNIIYANTNNYPFGSSYGANNYIAYNLVSGLLHSAGNPPPGPGNVANVDMDLVFVDFGAYDRFDNDWQLKAGSPAIGAGENGIDCGMFGGPSPYVLSGLAPIPHIYEAIVPISGSTSTGLPVTIKIKSQN